MICVKKITDEKVLKCDINERAFVGGHYCYNWTLLKELKNGPYKFLESSERTRPYVFLCGL